MTEQHVNMPVIIGRPRPRTEIPARQEQPLEDALSRAKPTDDELGEALIEHWNGTYAHLYGAWHRYAAGLWKADQRVELQFWNILIRNKKRGIKPNAGKASSVQRYCELKTMVDEEELTREHPYINLRNGLINLDTFALEEHRPDLYLTSQLAFDYDPAAKCPAWMRFLTALLVTDKGETDYDMIALVQEAFGYTLTAETGYRVSFWLVGLSGTGKSTLLNVLTALAGDTHVGIDLEKLNDNPYQIASIAGKRLVTFTEPDANAPLPDGWYKKLVSRDVVSARQIHGKPFNFVPNCKLWGAMNHTPRVADRSDAVFSRVIIIPMNRVIPEDKRDPDFEARLIAEIPGIFEWALLGLKRLRRQGHFTRPEQSERARNDYRHENDAEALFISERCTIAPNTRVSNDELYQAYRAWCGESGYSPKAKERVGRDWKRMGFISCKTTSGNARAWQGVTIQTFKPDL